LELELRRTAKQGTLMGQFVKIFAFQMEKTEGASPRRLRRNSRRHAFFDSKFVRKDELELHIPSRAENKNNRDMRGSRSETSLGDQYV